MEPFVQFKVSKYSFYISYKYNVKTSRDFAAGNLNLFRLKDDPQSVIHFCQLIK